MTIERYNFHSSGYGEAYEVAHRLGEYVAHEDHLAITNKMKAIIYELQWIWQPYDDYYHKESGYYCQLCGNEQEDGHKPNCDIAKL